jgi:teichuronic acid biosynthesis glycosyltransferase TuaG
MFKVHERGIYEMGLTSPLVSVIIPSWNSRIFLESAIASVEAQTFKNYEIIIIDDGSTDDTCEWAESNSGRFRYYKTSNQGQASARNYGAELAKGEYLAFLDSDDMWLPDKLKAQVEALSKHVQYSFVFSDGYRIVSSEHFDVIRLRSQQVERLSTLYSRPLNPFTIHHEFRMHSVPTSSMFLRKSDYASVGGMPILRQGEDYVLCCLLLMNKPGLYLDEPLFYYRVHQKNISAVVKSKRKSIKSVLGKDYARVYVSQVSQGKPNIPAFIRDYSKLPLFIRLFLLLFWRFEFGTSNKKIIKDIIRYLKA